MAQLRLLAYVRSGRERMGDPAHTALLQGRKLGRSVGQRWIWRGLDIEIDAAQRLGVAGASGTGKSLLLRALAGLDPIDEGQILFRGQAPSALGMPRYRARVVYLHQRPGMLPGSVEHNLRAPFALKAHAGRSYPDERARALLSRLGQRDNLYAESADKLSGGESQAVALVRALLIEPSVLLLDEATASLDPERVALVEKMIETWLPEDPERAVVWVTHSREQLLRVTDRLVELEDDR